jgi:GNAT superfamily N-acetyltransferase
MIPAARPRPFDPREIDIRLASAGARRSCLQIHDGYTTSRMWQPLIRAVDDPGGALALSGPGGEDTPFSVTFQPLRLPRPLQEPGLAGSRAPAQRAAAWAAADCMLVAGPPRPAPPPAEPDAEPEEPDDPEIWGYVALNGAPGAGLAWIAELVVALPHRRRGLGHMLVEAARAWAGAPVDQGGGGGLGALLIELSPRNYPGIAFCRHEGFGFAGYTDYTKAGGDLRLFFLRATL